jgi:hypothetical protein
MVWRERGRRGVAGGVGGGGRRSVSGRVGRESEVTNSITTQVH